MNKNDELKNIIIPYISKNDEEYIENIFSHANQIGIGPGSDVYLTNFNQYNKYKITNIPDIIDKNIIGNKTYIICNFYIDYIGRNDISKKDSIILKCEKPEYETIKIDDIKKYITEYKKQLIKHPFTLHFYNIVIIIRKREHVECETILKEETPKQPEKNLSADSRDKKLNIQRICLNNEQTSEFCFDWQ
jgi:hypothetical protein